jgi:cyanate permease
LSFKDSLLSLITNRNFLLIFTSFSIIAGLTNTVTSLLAQIVISYGVSVDQAGYLGAAFIVAGLVGGFSCGFLIDKTRRHILIIKIFVPILGCMYLGLLFVGRSSMSYMSSFFYVFNYHISQRKWVFRYDSHLHYSWIFYFCSIACFFGT